MLEIEGRVEKKKSLKSRLGGLIKLKFQKYSADEQKANYIIKIEDGEKKQSLKELL
jgi:hypothetical protein